MVSTAAIVAAIATPALAQSKRFDIAAQPASTGIPQLATQADIQILVSEAAARGRMIHAVHGAMTTDQALRAMLAGSGLRIASWDGRTYTLAADEPAPPTTAVAAPMQEIVVTATRRQTTVQTAPINIAAIGADQIEKQRLGNLRQITRAVPGVYIPDSGARSGSTIIFRGLNANALSVTDANDGGGTVATYLGEIPLYVDLRLNDMERVEFLAGPQGTLYGAGTLGGAIRYIPNRPQFDATTLEVRGEGFGYDHGHGVSYNAGATVNVPISSTLAFRASVDRLSDLGFIDEPYAVNTLGVSNPDPDFSDAADVKANTHRNRDVNTDKVWSGRAGLRWKPSDKLDANLTYYYQNEKTNGRQASSVDNTNFPVAVGEYELLKRIPEPAARRNQLLSLEVTGDLGFATLTSATGRSWFRQNAVRDQTDLLIGLDYGYSDFPDFTAPATEHQDTQTFTQELRLVSKLEGPFSFIFGGFYNDKKDHQLYEEFTPGYSEFLIDDEGYPGTTRPDNLEFISASRSGLKEMAAYGELSYKITPKWQVTAGGRYYHYSLTSANASDTPLFNTAIGDYGPDEINLAYQQSGQKDSGFLYKFNTSYQITRDVMVYATASQGYRIGNSNGIAPCPAPPIPNNALCALPDELQYKPDKTNNYEIGLKSQWFDRRLTVNASVYDIEWKNPQLASATQYGLIDITRNGDGARSRGFELLVAAKPTSRWSLRATYAYTDPTLTKETPNLIPYITPPGFQSTLQYLNGEPGDRLPGSPHSTVSFYTEYGLPLSDDKTLSLSYNFSGQTNVLTSLGGKGGSYTLPGFTRSDLAARLESKRGQWSVTFYVDNIFNKFAETNVNNTPAYNQEVFDLDGGSHYTRGFYTTVLPPRQIGVRFVKSFGAGT